jgi:microcystin-dependent protein
MKRLTMIICGAMLACLAAKGQTSTVPSVINYQGTLYDDVGNLMTNGYYGMAFRIWDQATGGTTPVWGRTFTNYVRNGQFNVLLSDNGPVVTNLPAPLKTNLVDALEGQPRYLAMTVISKLGVPVAIPVEIVPRQQLVSAPIAIHALTAVNVTTAVSATNAAFAQTAANATNSTRAANGVPPGAMAPYGGVSAPAGWMLCDGTPVSRTTYAELFAVVGTNYGAGDGSTTFNLPNFKTRTPVGMDTGDTDFSRLGKTGGAKTHTLATNEIPAHAHTVSPPSTNTASAGAHTHEVQMSDGAGWSGLVDSSGNGTVQWTKTTTSGGSHTHSVSISPFNSGSTGGSTAHNNLQPYLVVNYIIKY